MKADEPISPRLLRALRVPPVDPDGDKEDRGRVLVVGGSRTVAGAVLLAGTAALRAGAGKLQVATVESASAALAVALPEAAVHGLPELGGALSPTAARVAADLASRAQVLVLGPGMVDPVRTVAFARGLLAQTAPPAAVLDAGALTVLRDDRGALRAFGGNAVITPHAGELARILGETPDDPPAAARSLAAAIDAVVVLKGSDTYVVDPSGRTLRYTGGSVGLATSGSGDVLAGAIGGLLARGAPALAAAAWGVWAHGEAGNRLARDVAPVGYLARELLAELPALLARS